MLEGAAVPLKAIKVSADHVEVLRPERAGKGGNVPAGENPLQVRILRRVQRRQGVAGVPQDLFRHAAPHVAEERGIATEAAHEKAREEKPEQKTPAPRIPSAL